MAYQLGTKPNNFDDLSSRFQTIHSFPNILDISSSFLNFSWKKPISSIKPLWFSVSGIKLANRNTTENIYILPIFTVVLPIHPFSNFFIFFPVYSTSGQVEETYFFQDAIKVSWQ